MISVKVLSKQAEKIITDNAPVILTAVGAVGAIGAAFLTGKATFAASDLLVEEQERRTLMNEPELTGAKDRIKVVWKEYVPAAGVLSLSVTSIICANRVSTRRAAAMAAAYSLSEKAYSEYREKVIEKFNVNKERQIRDEIAQDKVEATPIPAGEVIVVGNGDVTCFDFPTGRYFTSNMEAIRRIQNDLNLEMIETGAVTLGHLYAAVGLQPTPFAEELGWTSDHPLEIKYSAVLKNGQPVISINYEPKPIRGRFQGCIDEPSF